MYTRSVPIEATWEERDVQVIVSLDPRVAAQTDPGFDIRTVSLIGFKMAIPAGSAAAVAGTIWLDDFVVEPTPRWCSTSSSPNSTQSSPRGPNPPRGLHGSGRGQPLRSR
jgi:hypothetical protein